MSTPSILETLLPTSHGTEHHSVALTAAPAEALAAASEVTWREAPRSARLMMVRSSRRGDSVLVELSRQMSFMLLADAVGERVWGTVLRLPFGKPVALASREEFLAPTRAPVL